jgi:uncharacterized membrane protein YcaP (DUF421 family)
VHHGRLIAQNLDRERIPPDEIFSEMHKVGLETLDQVKWAILEADGKLSFVATDRQLPRWSTRRHESPACRARHGASATSA